MTNVLIIAILSSCSLLPSSSSLPDISEVCPYLNVCNIGKGQKPVDDISQTCCLPCSCSDTCALTGTCCPDKTTVTTPAKTFPCRAQQTIYRKYLKTEKIIRGQLGYRVIDECPADYELGRFGDENIIRCKEAKELMDVVFVTSRQSGQTYLNENCARCNGEDDLVIWNLYLTNFYNGLLFKSLEERDEFLLKSASFQLVPPPINVALTAFCSLTSISKCNDTGLWDFSDKELERKCESYNSLFILNHFSPSFSNVYCFMCNYPKGTPVQQQCEISDGIYNPGRGSGFAPLHALVIGLKTEDRGNYQCSLGAIMDPFSERCSDIICPPGTIPGHTTCEPLLDEVVGYGIMVSLDLKTESDFDTHTINYDILLDDLAIIPNTLTTKNGLRCGVCTLSIHPFQGNTFKFRIDVQSSKKCNYIGLLENIFNTCKTMPLILYSRSLQSNVTVLFSGDQYDTKNTLPLKARYFSRCRVSIEFSPMIVHCPSVLFNISDVSEKCNNYCFQSKLGPYSFHLGNGTYIICIDHYTQAFIGLNRGHPDWFDMHTFCILSVLYLIYQMC